LTESNHFSPNVDLLPRQPLDMQAPMTAYW